MQFPISSNNQHRKPENDNKNTIFKKSLVTAKLASQKSCKKKQEIWKLHTTNKVYE